MIRGRVGRSVGAPVSQDGRVQAAIETNSSQVWIGANPVVTDGLICLEDEGISLASEYLNLVHNEWLSADTVNLDDGQVVAVNGECVVGIARDGYQTETVTFSSLDGNRSKFRGWPSRISASAVNQGRISGGELPSRWGRGMIPERQMKLAYMKSIHIIVTNQRP